MGDTSKHLTYFRVENFKRFESFEMNDLGQFNLIVGDNNVGKTSVLEALLFDRDKWQLINNLIHALDFRRLKESYIFQDFELYANKDNILSSISVITFSWREQKTEESAIRIEIHKGPGSVSITADQQPDVRSFNSFETIQLNPHLNFPFIPFYIGHDQDLANFYSKLQKNRTTRNAFVKALSILIPDIDNIELSSPYPQTPPHLIVYQKSMQSSLPLALFGDGALKLFRLLAAIITNHGGRLMIDEIDTGIHFSRFKEFWRIILKTAKENDVQLFMTTHSEECLRYFKEVLDTELTESKKDARNITLIEGSEKKVKAFTYTFDQIEANIGAGNEIRGGAR